jgi:hypothetical protein
VPVRTFDPRGYAAAACVVLLIAVLYGCAGPTQRRPGEDQQASAAVRCKVAMVSPVSGNAECVEPRGAPVDPPPPRPPPAKEDCLRHSDLDVSECRT